MIRARPYAAGNNAAEKHEDLDSSRDGFGTKIHVAFDALGNLLTVERSPGQDADIKHTVDVLADKAYDSDAFAATIKELGAEVVIRPKSKRV